MQTVYLSKRNSKTLWKFKFQRYISSTNQPNLIIVYLRVAIRHKKWQFIVPHKKKNVWKVLWFFWNRCVLKTLDVNKQVRRSPINAHCSKPSPYEHRALYSKKEPSPKASTESELTRLFQCGCFVFCRRWISFHLKLVVISMEVVENLPNLSWNWKTSKLYKV